MKKLKKYFLTVVSLTGLLSLKAQQTSLFNTYALDPLQLNIAYAGASCTEANLHYRTQWIGLKETPKVFQVNAHTALGKSNGLGLRVNSQSQGLLNLLGATVGYSYRIKVSETAKVHLGIGAGFAQAAINSQRAVVVDANDATLNNNSRQTASGFDSEFGAMFIGRKLKGGVSALHLYSSNPDFTGSSSYKSLPQINSQISYILNKDKKIEVEPSLLSRYTIKGNHVLETFFNVQYAKTLVLGLGYRTNYGMMVLLGAKLGHIRLGYSFDYGGGKNATNLGTSHQIMLGFNMCRPAKPKPEEEQPPVATEQPTVLPTIISDLDPAKKQEEKPETVKPVETPLNTNPEESVSLEGVLKTGENPGTALKNTKIKLVNDKGEIVGETQTNNNGAFAFRKIPAAKDFLVVADEGATLPEGTRVSLTNLNGKEIRTMNTAKEPVVFKILGSDEGTMNDMKADDASLTMNITGYLLNQEQKPISNAHLKIKEENGTKEQKIVTDVTGKFNCNNLDAEKTYLIEAEDNDPAFAGVSAIKFANINGKVYRVVELGSGKIAFKLLENDKNELGEFKVEETEAITNDLKKQEVAKVETPVVPVKMEEPVKTEIKPENMAPETALKQMNFVAEEVIFEFNQTQLEAADLKKLDKIAEIMRKSPELRINIIGHTCNIGTKEVNDMVSIRRATYVRNELVRRGVNIKNIDRSIGVGAEKQLYDNSNPDSQVKNRTVRFEMSN